jgi:hypothetical protein
MDYTDVSPPNINRRDNITLALSVIVGQDDVRNLQAYMLWSRDYEPTTEYFTSRTYTGSYNDRTTAAMDLGTNYVTGGSGTIVYVGLDHIFNDVDFLHQTFGDGVTRTVQYWNGSWTAVSSLVDNTSSFTADGNITYTMPSDWATTSVDGVTKYWLRINLSTVVTTAPIFYYVRPTGAIVVLIETSVDGGVTWEFYNEEDYYPNVWVFEAVAATWRPRTAQAFTTMLIDLLEGY